MTTRRIEAKTAGNGGRAACSFSQGGPKLLPLVDALDAQAEALANHAAQLKATISRAYDPADKKYEMCMRHAEIRAFARTLKLLGHSQPQTTQRYAHLDADPMHKAANIIGSQIAAAIAHKPE